MQSTIETNKSLNRLYANFLAAVSLAGISMCSGSALAGLITVEPTSSITSGSYIYYYWGHENATTVPMAEPGSGTAISQHGTNPIQVGHDFSTTGFSLSNPNANELDLSLSLNNTLDYGSYTRSEADYYFTLTGDTSYDLSGSYSSSRNGGFSVSILDLDKFDNDLQPVGLGRSGWAKSFRHSAIRSLQIAGQQFYAGNWTF